MGETQRFGKIQTRTIGKRQGNPTRENLKGVLKMNVRNNFREFKKAHTNQIKSTTAFFKLRVKGLFGCVQNKIKTGLYI